MGDSGCGLGHGHTHMIARHNIAIRGTIGGVETIANNNGRIYDAQTANDRQGKGNRNGMAAGNNDGCTYWQTISGKAANASPSGTVWTVGGATAVHVAVLITKSPTSPALDPPKPAAKSCPTVIWEFVPQTPPDESSSAATHVQPPTPSPQRPLAPH